MNKVKTATICFWGMVVSDAIFKLLSLSIDKDLIKSVRILKNENEDLKKRIEKLEGKDEI